MSTKRAPEPYLDWGTDLTAAARAGRLDPLIGREAILERVLLVLARKTKNNPVLLGLPGVGKTAIAEGLAAKLVEGTVPPRLQGRELFSLNLGNLLAGTSYRGDFEQRLRQLMDSFQNPHTPRMLFVDELHLLAKTGKSEGGLDAANLLKPLLARGGLPCLGATTPNEWNELIEADPAIERRFQPIEVPPATKQETTEILRGLKDAFSGHHNVEITDEALVEAIEEAVRNPAGRLLPDRAIDLLDEACARVVIGTHSGTKAAESAAERSNLMMEARDRFDLKALARLMHKAPAQKKDKRLVVGPEHIKPSNIENV